MTVMKCPNTVVPSFCPTQLQATGVWSLVGDYIAAGEARKLLKTPRRQKIYMYSYCDRPGRFIDHPGSSFFIVPNFKTSASQFKFVCSELKLAYRSGGSSCHPCCSPISLPGGCQLAGGPVLKMWREQLQSIFNFQFH